ncbi:MAG: efflux RND transporter periplasmic adaptor subunit, partial [Eubacterium sp.]|nr:efflux RND transporter periplasmic adaptor subunit [Eubacterium sp.]
MKNPLKSLSRKKNPDQTPEPKGKKTKIKKIRKIVLMVLIPLALIAAIVGGVMYYNDKSQKKVDVYSVGTLNSASWWEDDSSLTGTLISDYVQSVNLTSGKEVEKIFVKTGDTVKPGDNLLKYNVQEQELDLQLQELQIKSSTLAIENLQKELEKLKGT